MSTLISIIIFLVSAYISYWIFERYSFAIAWVITTVITVLRTLFEAKVAYTGGLIILMIIVSAIVSLITTGLEYFVYKRSNSFWGYVGGTILMGFAIGLVLMLIGVAIAMNTGAAGMFVK